MGRLRRTYLVLRRRRSTIRIAVGAAAILLIVVRYLYRFEDPTYDIGPIVEGRVGMYESPYSGFGAELETDFLSEVAMRRTRRSRGLPLRDDSDHDDVPDSVEHVFGMSSTSADSDSDGHPDADELLAGSDPLSAADFPSLLPDPEWALNLRRMMMRVDLVRLTARIADTEIDLNEARALALLQEIGGRLPADIRPILRMAFAREPNDAELEVFRHQPPPHDDLSVAKRIIVSAPAATAMLSRVYRRLAGKPVSDAEADAIAGDTPLISEHHYAQEVAVLFASERFYRERCRSMPVHFIRLAYLRLLGRPPTGTELSFVLSQRSESFHPGMTELEWRIGTVSALTMTPRAQLATLADSALMFREALRAW